MSKQTVEGSTLDPVWIEGHMERWLARSVHEDQIDDTRAAIRRALAENPRLVDWHSWPEIAARGK